jgi:hypothetical protein
MCSCEQQSSPLKVAVLLSGGVDSSLSLALLKAAGHQVHAFYLQIWFQEDFRNFWDACPWEEDLEYAQKVLLSNSVPSNSCLPAWSHNVAFRRVSDTFCSPPVDLSTRS